MTKEQFIKKLTEDYPDAFTSKKSANAAYDAIFGTLKEAILSDGEVRVNGFGTFSIVDRKARKGIDPRTHEKIDVPASKAVRFKAAANVKREVNGK